MVRQLRLFLSYRTIAVLRLPDATWATLTTPSCGSVAPTSKRYELGAWGSAFGTGDIEEKHSEKYMETHHETIP